jgi:hypothetical protein
MRIWADNVREVRNPYKILVEKPEGEIPLEDVGLYGG